ncbi:MULTISPECIES: TerD family protein [Oscillospiraceae]|uniref:TerD family protein n=1 Tax=Oscillospiraceae TaxID=216572 RepID=UPI000B3AD1D0|nr:MULTISPECIES: TerD family protein [Oscillospiraceae]MBM6724510.1 TerD family protein [Pseudoflavonifractor phocaeensis]OUO40174.1 stress protein [Flavonifractor sp. An306]
MSVSLQKGQKVSLTKEGQEGLNQVIVGLGWDEAQANKGGLLGGLFGSKPQAIDCDASALMLRGGRLLDGKDIIYFGNLQHPTGAVRHMGDNLTGAGAGDDEQIVIQLQQVPAEYDRIVFVVNIYQAVQRNQHFGMIRNAFIHIMDARNNQELCRYNLSENYDGMTAMIFGEAYRHNGEWKFNAIGQGTTDPGLPELCRRYM